ncbi:MAG: diguanylate cyclase domain-containing protein [Lachnospiraceae bacterium]
MNAFKRLKRHRLFMPMVTFVIAFTLLSLLYLVFSRADLRQKQERYTYIAGNEANGIRDCFDKVTARVFTLSALLDNNNGSADFFEKFAPVCYEEVQLYCNLNLKSIAIAPDGIVQYAYPLQENESLIGFDFMDTTRPENEDAIRSYKEGKLVVTNPSPFVTDGSEMAVRLPVYNSDNTFWGLITITMDYDEFIRTANLQVLSNMGVDYDLWYEDAEGNHITMSASEKMPKQPVTCHFSMQNLEWNLSVAPSDGWIPPLTAVFSFFLIDILALLITLFFYNRARIRETSHKLRQMAYFDALTMCYSRQYINTVLVDQKTGQWYQRNTKYSLAIVDLDHFKNVNDQYGHIFGDRVLSLIAETLKGCLVPERGDSIIRYGGDEFVLLFQDVTKEEFAERLSAAVEATHNLHLEDYPEAKFSLSIGGAAYTDPEHSRYYTLLEQADEKLYHSKENGRDRYTV